MDHPGDLASWLRLTLIPGIGAERQRKLLSAFGLPARIFASTPALVAGVIGEKSARQLFDTDCSSSIARAVAWADEPGNHIITLGDAAYPPALLNIADPPVLLYAKGDLSLLGTPAIAVVGARSATAQGLANARAFAGELARSGLAIVSGLALGIDAAAHQGALDADGATIAIIGTGADRIYPAGNQALARAIAASGLILSEFPLGTGPLRANFPRRNRLISGLSKGVLVVEAAPESGSLITAREAAEQGREVFAIPGSIHSPLSKGCHQLIRQGAKLVETASDILEELALPPATTTRTASEDSTEAWLGHPPEVVTALGHDPVDMDTLAIRSGLTPDTLYAILLAMELDGLVARLPGGRFQRL